MPEKIKIDLEKHIFKIGFYHDIIILIQVITKSNLMIQRVIYFKTSIILPLISITDVPVYYTNAKLPNNRDFLLEPRYYEVLGDTGNIYSYIVNSNISFV